MAKRVSYSRSAIRDLDEVWNYTAHAWGLDQAELYTRQINARCCEIAEGLASVSLVDVGTVSFIKAASGSHRIFAIEKIDVLIVVRILHERQDPAGKL